MQVCNNIPSCVNSSALCPVLPGLTMDPDLNKVVTKFEFELNKCNVSS